MRWLGHADARVTVDGPDKGLDVVARDAFGQVKRQTAGIGAPALQGLFGARGLRQGQLYFFTSSRYSKRALEYADQHHIAAFSFSVDTGLVAPESTRAGIVYRAALQKHTAAAQAAEQEAAARRAATQEATAHHDAARRAAERRAADRRAAEQRAAEQRAAERRAAEREAAERDAADREAAARNAAGWAATRTKRPANWSAAPPRPSTVPAGASVHDAIAASRVNVGDPQQAYESAVAATGCGVAILLPIALCAGGSALVYDSTTGQIVAALATGLLFLVALTGTRAIRRRRRVLSATTG